MSEQSFSSRLNDYCGLLSCSNKELAEACGISASSLSRYRRGERIPNPEGETLRHIAAGIVAQAQSEGVGQDLEEDEVLLSLVQSIESERPNAHAFRIRLDDLMRGLSITNAEMARHAHVDPSFLSRIRNGQRFPAEHDRYARSFSTLVARRCIESDMVQTLAAIMDSDEGAQDTDASTLPRDQEELARRVEAWLLEDGQRSATGVEHFLGSLDEFDLNEYTRSIHYDELKIPNVPVVVPTSKAYYGVRDMREAELAFLRTTATSKHANEITMFSDMSLSELAQDPEFVKKYALGVAAMIKRGVRLNVIHDVTRPFGEMMVGLEGWIPLYMTGQVHPYYFRGDRDRVFGHLCYASDVAVLSAESIRGHHNEGRYFFSTKREEVAYGMRRARLLLERATPLMEIIRESDTARYARFLQQERERQEHGHGVVVGADSFRNISIVSYEPDLVVVRKENAPRIVFVIRHPRLCDAIARMTL